MKIQLKLLQKLQTLALVLLLTLSSCTPVYASGISSTGDIGAKSATAVTDPTADASTIAALKGVIKQLQGNGTGSAPVTLATALSSTYDSIDMSKASKGAVTTTHSAITATVAEASCTAIDCRGFNAISVEMTVSGLGEAASWTGAIYGSSDTVAYGVCYTPKDDGTFVAQTTPAIAAASTTTYYFIGIPNYIKVVPTLAVTGTLTCKVTPMNM